MDLQFLLLLCQTLSVPTKDRFWKYYSLIERKKISNQWEQIPLWEIPPLPPKKEKKKEKKEIINSKVENETENRKAIEKNQWNQNLVFEKINKTDKLLRLL